MVKSIIKLIVAYYSIGGYINRQLMAVDKSLDDIVEEILHGNHLYKCKDGTYIISVPSFNLKP